MILADAAIPTDLIGYLATACAGLVTAIGILFWQLLASKGETIALAKELIPVSTALLAAAQAFQKVVDRQEGRS